MTEQVESTEPQVAWFMRFLVTSLYIAVSIFFFIGLAYLFTSDGCPSKNRCTEPDQIIFAVVGLIDFVLGFGLLFFGMKGRLPGTKQHKS